MLCTTLSRYCTFTTYRQFIETTFLFLRKYINKYSHGPALASSGRSSFLIAGATQSNILSQRFSFSYSAALSLANLEFCHHAVAGNHVVDRESTVKWFGSFLLNICISMFNKKQKLSTTCSTQLAPYEGRRTLYIHTKIQINNRMNTSRQLL